jgi:hypothetical protein
MTRQQQPVCECDMCTCDPAEETTITIEEQE